MRSMLSGGPVLEMMGSRLCVNKIKDKVDVVAVVLVLVLVLAVQHPNCMSVYIVLYNISILFWFIQQKHEEAKITQRGSGPQKESRVLKSGFLRLEGSLESHASPSILLWDWNPGCPVQK